MSSLMNKVIKAALLTVIFVVLPGCAYNNGFDANAAGNELSPVRAYWVAYWDVDRGAHELAALGNNLDKLSFFEAYFDKDDKLFLPAELTTEIERQKAKQLYLPYETYLTFVNDHQEADGSVTVKDLAVLRRIFMDDRTVDRHIISIIGMTLQGGYSGIEIDYERVWKDPQVAAQFAQFITKLQTRANEVGLKLRVVLEPSTPFTLTGLPEGPEYVVMFYNLYGTHSGPGPKADDSFIAKTIAGMKKLPGNRSAAFATGGCQWGSNGQKVFLTEAEAAALVNKAGVAPQRDFASKCLVFNYNDKGVSYTVWYADTETLNHWISEAKARGINNISIWRLGGNRAVEKLQ